MHDFPPVVPDLPRFPAPTDRRRGRRDFGAPDTQSPSRFLAWLLGQQWPTLLVASLVAVAEFVPGAFGPYVVGRIVDDGILGGDPRVVAGWAGLLLGLIVVGVSAGIARHSLIVRTWLVAMYATMALVTRKAVQLGHVLGRRTPTGEVLSVADSDSDSFGGLTEILSRAVGALLAYAAVAGIVLSTSIPLGLVVLVAAPLLLGLAVPLLRPLQRSEEVERTRSAELVGLAVDIVAGLRILRGIGGEQTFAGNYARLSQRTRRAGVIAGTWQAALEATGTLFSGALLAVLTWLGAREVVAGRLSVGELISFFGYAVFMVWPIRTFFELAQKWVRAVVSARKAIAILEQQPPWREPEAAAELPGGAALQDLHSGFVAAPGQLTCVVSAQPDDSAALADRLGRYLPSEDQPVPLDVPGKTKGRAARTARRQQLQARAQVAKRDAARAREPWGVRVGSVDLADAPVADVRRHVLVSDAASAMFAGTMQEAIDPTGRLTRIEAERALHTACAEDVFDALPDGWQGRIDERGRGLSGGQRQRLVLARAVAADPEILVLVEPTSAVDAHTEAVIADRLPEHRRGRTTVVMSGSPLLLRAADQVAFLDDARVVDAGTHEQLLSRSQAYRRVVVRDLDNPDNGEVGERHEENSHD